MMNFPGVLNEDEEVMKKIGTAHRLLKPVDGHAPGLRGLDAKKYIDWFKTNEVKELINILENSNVNEIERLNKIIGELTELLDTQQNQQLQDEGLNDSISVRPKPTRVGTTPVKIIPSPSYYENISKGNQASIVRGTSEAMTPIKIIPQPGRVTGNNAPISDLFFSEAPRLPGTGFGNFGGGGEPSR